MLSTSKVRPQAAPFALGRLALTRGAVETLEPKTISSCFLRHAKRDFGDLCDEDFDANLDAIRCGERILSVYRCENKQGEVAKIYVITEADRSVTTLLLAEEY
jgi:hypothetical protein